MIINIIERVHLFIYNVPGVIPCDVYCYMHCAYNRLYMSLIILIKMYLQLLNVS